LIFAQNGVNGGLGRLQLHTVGLTPVIEPQVAKEFIGRGNQAADNQMWLVGYMGLNGAVTGPPPDPGVYQAFLSDKQSWQGQPAGAVNNADLLILASAFAWGTPVLTNDGRFKAFMTNEFLPYVSW